MKMNLLLYVLLVPGYLTASTIKGRVVNEQGFALVGVNVLISGTSFGAATDEDGFYEITNVLPGKHILKCSYVGCPSKTDTVDIKEFNDVTVMDFCLAAERDDRVVPDSIKNYNTIFTSYKLEEILKLHIDSLSSDYSIMYLSFTNKTMFPVYLSPNFEIINFTRGILRDEEGESVKSNAGFCGTFYPELPGVDDIVILKPFESINFPPVRNIYYWMWAYPKGKYHFRVKYQVDKFTLYPQGYIQSDEYSFKEYKKDINVITYLTRGTFYSDNEIIVENK